MIRNTRFPNKVNYSLLRRPPSIFSSPVQPGGYNRSRRAGIVNVPKLAAYIRTSRVDSSDNVQIRRHNGPLCGIDAVERAVVRANASRGCVHRFVCTRGRTDGRTDRSTTTTSANLLARGEFGRRATTWPGPRPV